MLTARIQLNNKETLVYFPCTKRALATKLSRIGIQTPASKLPCETQPESEVKIAISAGEQHLHKLASLASKASSLESVNSVCAIFEEMPLNAQTELLEKIEGGEIESFSELAQNVYMYKPITVSEKYYCPLAVLVYDDYDGYYNNYDGFGEGFEQRPIKINEGEMYVSFWNSSNEYFIYDEKEMQSYLKEQNQSYRMEGLM